MAKLPASLIKHADPLLRDLPVGSTGFVSVAAMEVDSELNCFLRPGIRYQTHKDILNPVLVTRQADGYHVVLLAHWQWEPEPFNPEGWLSVVTLTERYDPELDRFTQKSKQMTRLAADHEQYSNSSGGDGSRARTRDVGKNY